MDVFERIFGRSGSASTAKKRLQLVITQDRTNISPETLNLLKDEIVAAISKHVDIDAANVEVTIANDEEGHHLTANIPVLSSRRIQPRNRNVSEPRKTT